VLFRSHLAVVGPDAVVDAGAIIPHEAKVDAGVEVGDGSRN
jgi:UDP-3-O-[3-hydroxymyristoyl] glucosamine N-acyltransferase